MRLVMDDPRLLDVVAQPIVDLTDGRPAGFELLARVPRDWVVPPDRLFAAARRLGCPPGCRPRSTSGRWRCWHGCPTAASSPSTSTRPTSPRPTWWPRSSTSRCSRRSWSRSPSGSGPSTAARPRTPCPRCAAGAPCSRSTTWGRASPGSPRSAGCAPRWSSSTRPWSRTSAPTRPPSSSWTRSAGSAGSSTRGWSPRASSGRTSCRCSSGSGSRSARGSCSGAGRSRGPPSTARRTCSPCPPRRTATTTACSSAASSSTAGAAGWERDATGAYRRAAGDRTHRAMTMAPTTRVADALLRAVARPPDDRWEPVLATDSTGTALGQVTVETLVTARAGARRARRGARAGRHAAAPPPPAAGAG